MIRALLDCQILRRGRWWIRRSIPDLTENSAVLCLIGSKRLGLKNGSGSLVTNLCRMVCLAGMKQSGCCVKLENYLSNLVFSLPKSLEDGMPHWTVSAFTDELVNRSTDCFRLTSTNRLNFPKKSAPMIALGISAIINMKEKILRKPRLTLSNFLPYVLMFNPLAAAKIISDGFFL